MTSVFQCALELVSGLTASGQVRKTHFISISFSGVSPAHTYHNENAYGMGIGDHTHGEYEGTHRKGHIRACALMNKDSNNLHKL